MPQASRPKRIRIRAAILILMGRAITALNNNQDGSVWEVADSLLSRVLKMYNEAGEPYSGANGTVETKADALMDYLETNDPPYSEDTVGELSGDLASALVSAGY